MDQPLLATKLYIPSQRPNLISRPHLTERLDSGLDCKLTLLSANPYLIAGFLVMFSLVGHMSTIDSLLRIPLGLQEMVLAVWLIFKGFTPPAEGTLS